ncbi:MAG: hypothetical protein KY455_03575 [Euryarchaeota archaeon]|nr:hypothetical protein [Euryarchaeota archaeon]
MLPPGRTRISLLLVSLLVTTGMAGCLDNPFGKKNDRDDTDTKTIGFEIPGLERSPPGEEPGSDRPGGVCDGCIPLEPPGTPSRPPPVETPPPPVPSATFEVPSPRGGDILVVSRTDQEDVPERDGHPIPEPPLPTADWRLRVEPVSADVMVGMFGERDHEGGLFFQGTQVAEDGPGLQGFAVLVATEDRAVVAMETHHAVMVPTGSPLERSTSVNERAHKHPETETFFTFGSHLWGRTLRVGETFTVPHVQEHGDAPTMEFTYTVRQVGDAEARVQVDVETGGVTGTWTLTLVPTSPYPSTVEPGRTAHALPLPVQFGGTVWTESELQERGTEEVEIGPVARPDDGHPSFSTVHRPHGGNFRLDESGMSPVLFARPLYPLDRALNDLRTLDLAFRSFEDDHPGRVLVAAHLEPVWHQHLITRTPDAPLGTARWTLTYSDGYGHLRAWTVERLLYGDERLSDVPVATDEVQAGIFPPHVAGITMDRHGHVVLSTGDQAYEVLRDLGVRRVVDWVDYRLGFERDGHLGGTLSLGHLDPPSLTGEDPIHEATATVDLRAGAVTEFRTRNG